MSVFNFVIKSSYYSGKLPGLIATYLSFLLLGFTPVAIMFYKGLYYSALAGSSRAAFIVANLFFIGCLLFRVSYDIFICRRAGRFANKQSNICQKVLLNIQAEKAKNKGAVYSSDQDLSLKKYAGDHILDNTETMFQSLHTFIQSTVQSFFSVTSTMITIFLMGYGKLGIIASSIALSIIACNYHIQKNLVAKQQVKVKNLKVDARKVVQERFADNRAQKDKDNKVLNAYVKESNVLLDYDALRNWTYIFIKYTTEAVIMMIAVLLITKTFPLEMNSLSAGVLNMTVMMNLCQILASTVTDSSAIIRDFDKYAHAVSSYNNLSAQIAILSRDQGNIVERFHMKWYENNKRSRNIIWECLLSMLQAMSIGACALVVYTAMAQSGLVAATVPMGVSCFYWCYIVAASMILSKMMISKSPRAAEEGEDKIFLGLTWGTLVSVLTVFQGQCRPLWHLCSFVATNIAVVCFANLVMVPREQELKLANIAVKKKPLASTLSKIKPEGKLKTGNMNEDNGHRINNRIPGNKNH